MGKYLSRCCCCYYYINIDDELSKATFKNTPKFVPEFKKGFVIKVFDGDSVTIGAELQKKIYKFSVRLARIDCPELKGCQNNNEKICAKVARDRLKELILNKMVKIDVKCIEKYGRLLAEIYIDNINISDYLLKENLAIKYDGGSKNESKSTDWLKLLNKNKKNKKLLKYYSM